MCRVPKTARSRARSDWWYAARSGADRRAGPGGSWFHVKQGIARAPAHDPRSGRREVRWTKGRSLLSGGSSPVPESRATRGRPSTACVAACRRRRTWTARRVNAAGVTPSIWLAWPMVRGWMASSFCRLSEQAGQRRIVQIIGQCEALVAPIGGNVRRLPGQVDRILGIGLDLFRDARLQGRSSGQIRTRRATIVPDTTAARRPFARRPSFFRVRP